MVWNGRKNGFEQAGYSSEKGYSTGEYNNTQKTILLNEKWEYGGIPVEITLLFQKELFFGVTYFFPNEAEAGFAWAKSVYGSTAEKQGAPSTYPSLPDPLLRLDACGFSKENGSGLAGILGDSRQ